MASMLTRYKLRKLKMIFSEGSEEIAPFDPKIDECQLVDPNLMIRVRKAINTGIAYHNLLDICQKFVNQFHTKVERGDKCDPETAEFAGLVAEEISKQ